MRHITKNIMRSIEELEVLFDIYENKILPQLQKYNTQGVLIGISSEELCSRISLMMEKIIGIFIIHGMNNHFDTSIKSIRTWEPDPIGQTEITFNIEHIAENDSGSYRIKNSQCVTVEFFLKF